MGRVLGYMAWTAAETWICGGGDGVRLPSELKGEEAREVDSDESSLESSGLPASKAISAAASSRREGAGEVQRKKEGAGAIGQTEARRFNNNATMACPLRLSWLQVVECRATGCASLSNDGGGQRSWLRLRRTRRAESDAASASLAHPGPCRFC